MRDLALNRICNVFHLWLILSVVLQSNDLQLYCSFISSKQCHLGRWRATWNPLAGRVGQHCAKLRHRLNIYFRIFFGHAAESTSSQTG